MNGKIYKITNLVNGKIYIGQTTKRLSSRWHEHKRSSKCNALYGAIQKYGDLNFSIEIIDKTNDLAKLNELECLYIKLFNSTSPNGYNLRSGGENSLHSASSKLKMANKRRGIKMSQSTKDKISRSKSGIKIGPMTMETRLKISKSKSKVSLSSNHKIALSLAKNHKKHPVISIDSSGNEIFFSSISEASKILKVPKSGIRNILIGKKLSYFGYSFKKAEVKNVA